MSMGLLPLGGFAAFLMHPETPFDEGDVLTWSDDRLRRGKRAAFLCPRLVMPKACCAQGLPFYAKGLAFLCIDGARGAEDKPAE
jgi:hypothetical protein